MNESDASVSVSTPCQPAYADLARSMTANAGECRVLSE